MTGAGLKSIIAWAIVLIGAIIIGQFALAWGSKTSSQVRAAQNADAVCESVASRAEDARRQAALLVGPSISPETLDRRLESLEAQMRDVAPSVTLSLAEPLESPEDTRLVAHLVELSATIEEPALDPFLKAVEVSGLYAQTFNVVRGDQDGQLSVTGRLVLFGMGEDDGDRS